MAKIHPSAIVEDGAVLGADAEIGPFCHVGPKVKLGDGVRLVSHAIVAGDTLLGARSVVHPHAVIGGGPQYRGDDGSGGRLTIGSDCVIRESVTINMGSMKGGGLAEVGARCYFMAYSHVAHDCHIGDGVTFANGVAIAGHVSIGENANVGGLAAVHQYCRIGRNAFVGGLSGVAGDIIPFGIARGYPAALRGLNVIGLKRKGLTRTQIYGMREAYRAIFEGAGTLRERIEAAAARWRDEPEIAEMIAFLQASAKRHICVPPAGAGAESGEEP